MSHPKCESLQPILKALSEQAAAAQTLQAELNAYSGSATVYSHSLNRRFCYTEGFRHFLRSAGNGAYWLCDILALEPQIAKAVTAHGRMLAVLNVDCGVASLVVTQDRLERDRYQDVAFSQHIPYTDCPPGEWVFHLGLGIVGEQRVVIACLPGED